MTPSYSFRTAINGFHREDVVRYVEYINAKNANQTAQLKADLENAERELTELRELAGLQTRCQELEQENLELLQQLEALRQELADQKKQQPVAHSEAELEAYRRAERVERQAKEGAQMLMQQAAMVLANAENKVDDSAARISAISEQVMAQLQQLQQAVAGGKVTLQEASSALRGIKPAE